MAQCLKTYHVPVSVGYWIHIRMKKAWYFFSIVWLIHIGNHSSLIGANPYRERHDAEMQTWGFTKQMLLSVSNKVLWHIIHYELES